MANRSTVDLSAGQFSYLECGEGDPVVFLHALGREASDWSNVMESLGSRWRCIALDQRGHGQSVRPGEYTFEYLEADFTEFVDTLGLDRFALVAHSMGATVGWIFAAKNPERLDALILEDTPAPSDRHLYPDVPVTPPEPVTYDWEARRQLFTQLSSPDPAWRSQSPGITSPTLLIAGSENPEFKETAQRLPDCELITIDVGHWIHETEPGMFTDAVLAFITRK